MLTAPNFNVPTQSPASEWGPDLAGGGLSYASAEIPHVRTAHSAATGNFQDLFIIGAFISWMFRVVRNLLNVRGATVRAWRIEALNPPNAVSPRAEPGSRSTCRRWCRPDGYRRRSCRPDRFRRSKRSKEGRIRQDSLRGGSGTAHLCRTGQPESI